VSLNTRRQSPASLKEYRKINEQIARRRVASTCPSFLIQKQSHKSVGKGQVGAHVPVGGGPQVEEHLVQKRKDSKTLAGGEPLIYRSRGGSLAERWGQNEERSSGQGINALMLWKKMEQLYECRGELRGHDLIGKAQISLKKKTNVSIHSGEKSKKGTDIISRKSTHAIKRLRKCLKARG